MSDVYAVLLAGGSGTRFWPASRRATPKQFLAVTPGSSESLIAATLRRILPLVKPANVLIATGAHLLDAARAALPDLAPSAFLGEPMARNTAAGIGWATAVVARRDPEALVAVLPSDHSISDEQAFRATLSDALASAEAGTITTIGISPMRPETGYGYIELGETLGPSLHRVRRFVEKPDRETAEAYVRGGRHLWNSGMFFFRAQTMLDAIARHLPALHQGLERIEHASHLGAKEEERVTRAVFAELPSVSIDYGVMEKEPTLHVVSGSFGWNDLGSWQSAWELCPKDASSNGIAGSAVLVDASGNLVYDLRQGDERRVIALIGVSDLCVIQTEDALLVIPRERAQDVRLAVEALALRGDDRLT